MHGRSTMLRPLPLPPTSHHRPTRSKQPPRTKNRSWNRNWASRSNWTPNLTDENTTHLLSPTTGDHGLVPEPLPGLYASILRPPNQLDARLTPQTPPKPNSLKPGFKPWMDTVPPPRWSGNTLIIFPEFANLQTTFSHGSETHLITDHQKMLKTPFPLNSPVLMIYKLKNLDIYIKNHNFP